MIKETELDLEDLHKLKGLIIEDVEYLNSEDSDRNGNTYYLQYCLLYTSIGVFKILIKNQKYDYSRSI